MAGVRSLAMLAARESQTGVSFVRSVEKEQLYTVDVPLLAHTNAVGDSSDGWRENFLLKIDSYSPAIDIYCIDGCFITPNAGILTYSGTIIKESLYPYARTSDIHRAFSPFLFHEPQFPLDDLSIMTRNVTTISDDILFLREHGEMGYFHWIHSILPRWKIFKQAGISGRSFVALTEDFQRQSLKLMGADDESLAISDGNTTFCKRVYFCSPMVYPDLNRSGGFFERPLAASVILNSLGNKVQGCRRIFISRRDASIRRLLCEDEVESQLRSIGFETVTLSGMEFHEQIALFASSNIVIGLHGAGLSNIVFMRAGGLVIEVLAPDRLWPTYRGVAARSRLHYAPYVGDRAGSILDRDSDLFVDAKHFLNFINQAITKSA